MIMHTYFEKEMRTPFVVMRRSAMGEQQRMAILSNELIRRLSNVGKEVMDEEIIGIIEHYTYQLKMSEYERGQAREIIYMQWGHRVEGKDQQERKRDAGVLQAWESNSEVQKQEETA